MVALGLLLLVLTGTLAVGVVLSNTDPVTASAFGLTLTDVTMGGFFLVGTATGLMFMLGLMMMAAGATRRRARRAQNQRVVRDVRTEKEQLEQENSELRERLSDEPYPHEMSPAGAGGTDSGRHAKRGLFGRS